MAAAGSNLVALEQHLQRVRRLHQPRDALRAAAAGEQADLDLGQADARLLAVGDDAIVAGERQFETAAHADAIDRRGDRLAAGFEPPIDERQVAVSIDEGAHRGSSPSALTSRAYSSPAVFEHGEVGAAGEALLAGGEDGAFDRGVARRSCRRSRRSRR